MARSLVRCDDHVSLGCSPTVRGVEWLALNRGFRAILNLNLEGEPDELLSPNLEATWAHTYEMQHERVSIELSVPAALPVDEFLEALEGIAKPVYVHSRHGRRAAALATIHLALRRRWPGQKALARAEAAGIDCEDPGLKALVVAEVDGRRARPAEPRTAAR